MGMPKTQSTLTAAGVYIFAGGFTVGVMKHFRVLCHLEGSDYGVAVAKRNLPGLAVHTDESAWPVEAYRGRVNFVYGNPPCACWSGNNPNSHKNQGRGWEVDPRLSCTQKLFNLLTELKPSVWAWETVPQAFGYGKDFVYNLTRRAAAAGYAASYVFHDARYLGVPQTRKRLFVMFHRVAFTPETPRFDRVTSAVAALRAVEPRGSPAYDSGRFNRLFNAWLPRVKPGERLRRFWEREICPPDKWERKPNGHVRGRVGIGHIRLKTDGPATATVGYAMVHPTEHRFLHLNEIQALAGYPQSFDFGGSGMYAKELDLVARGVCPPVGEWLARSVAACLKDPAPVRGPSVTLYDYRVPGVEPVDLTEEVLGGNQDAQHQHGLPGGGLGHPLRHGPGKPPPKPRRRNAGGN